MVENPVLNTNRQPRNEDMNGHSTEYSPFRTEPVSTAAPIDMQPSNQLLRDGVFAALSTYQEGVVLSTNTQHMNWQETQVMQSLQTLRRNGMIIQVVYANGETQWRIPNEIERLQIRMAQTLSRPSLVRVDSQGTIRLIPGRTPEYASAYSDVFQSESIRASAKDAQVPVVTRKILGKRTKVLSLDMLIKPRYLFPRDPSGQRYLDDSRPETQIALERMTAWGDRECKRLHKQNRNIPKLLPEDATAQDIALRIASGGVLDSIIPFEISGNNGQAQIELSYNELVELVKDHIPEEPEPDFENEMNTTRLLLSEEEYKTLQQLRITIARNYKLQREHELQLLENVRNTIARKKTDQDSYEIRELIDYMYSLIRPFFLKINPEGYEEVEDISQELVFKLFTYLEKQGFLPHIRESGEISGLSGLIYISLQRKYIDHVRANRKHTNEVSLEWLYFVEDTNGNRDEEGNETFENLQTTNQSSEDEAVADEEIRSFANLCNNNLEFLILELCLIGNMKPRDVLARIPEFGGEIQNVYRLLNKLRRRLSRQHHLVARAETLGYK